MADSFQLEFGRIEQTHNTRWSKETDTVVKAVATPSLITERDAEDNRISDIKRVAEEVISMVTERKCCTESKMAFHTKRRKQCAGWSQRQVFLPNLDLDFVF